LKEQGEGEQEPELAEADDQGDRVASAEGPDSEQAQIEHDDLACANTSRLDNEEECQENDAEYTGDQDEGDRTLGPRDTPDEEVLGGDDPAVALALDQREDESDEPERDEQRAGHIEALAAEHVTGLGHDAEDTQDHDDPDRNVDKERPVP